jgi:hypothetical protein
MSDKKMNVWVVRDCRYGNIEIIHTATARQACVEFVKHRSMADNPKLCKMYDDGMDGKIYHTGYVYGLIWMTVSKVEWIREEV